MKCFLFLLSWVLSVSMCTILWLHCLCCKHGKYGEIRPRRTWKCKIVEDYWAEHKTYSKHKFIRYCEKCIKSIALAKGVTNKRVCIKDLDRYNMFAKNLISYVETNIPNRRDIRYIIHFKNNEYIVELWEDDPSKW